MALQKSYDGLSGDVHASAYHIVKEVRILKTATDYRAEILVNIYHDQTAKDTQKLTVDGSKGKKSYLAIGADYDEYFGDLVLSQEGILFIPQAYKYLKGKVAYYSDALDV